MKNVPFSINISSRDVPVRFVRMRNARRYVLRWTPAGIARVTIPRGGTLEFAVAFLKKHSDWLAKQVAQSSAAWSEGSQVLVRGELLTLRVIREVENLRVTLGDRQWIVREDESIRATIEKTLRREAEMELPRRTREIAGLHGLEPKGVSVRNQRSRWGSCSSKGRISLNWRLVQTPEFVRDYIIIHELMHMRELNHSDRFWRHVEGACPQYREAERWLRKHSGILR